MIICQCRNISDKDVKSYLEGQDGKVRPCEIKDACARQDCAECCHTCACTFLGLTKDHNAKVMVRDMGKAMETTKGKKDKDTQPA